MEEVLTEIKESIKILPSHVREVIIHTPWKARIEEIALKYSLTEKQKVSLFTEILLVLSIISPEEELVENLEKELQVSNVLAEQLTEEIEERIFSWIKKIYTEKERKKNEVSTKENALDIPPPNLPGEEIVDAPETIFAKEKHPTVSEQAKEFFAPQNTSETKPVAKTPTQTPKETFSPTTIPPIPQKPSFIAHKLTQPTRPQQTAPVEIPKTYTVDPYREPLE